MQFTPIRDAAWEQAGQLMAERGIPEADHVLLRENVATGLSHGSERWTAKVERDLASPYTDQQVMARCDELQNSLLENLGQLPSYPSKLYLTGSFCHGRLGANSDLDSYAVVAPEAVPATFKLFAERDEDPLAAKVFPFSSERSGYNEAMLMIAGASREIRPEDLQKPGFLRETYLEVLDRRKSRVETHPVYEWACSKMWSEELTPAEKIEQFAGKSLGTRALGLGLSLAGTLSQMPVIGVAVRGAAHLMVRQDHVAVN